MKKKFLIIGGGMTGCATALYLANNGFDVTICEKNQSLGGIAKDINFDFNHKSIDCVTFSLSKGFWGIDKLRCGIRFQRKDFDDPIDIYNKWSCVSMYSLSVAEKLFSKFEFDYNWNKFEKKYKKICNENKLKETNCILFALGDDKFSDFNRGSDVNRVCISNSLGDINE